MGWDKRGLDPIRENVKNRLNPHPTRPNPTPEVPKQFMTRAAGWGHEAVKRSLEISRRHRHHSMLSSVYPAPCSASGATL